MHGINDLDNGHWKGWGRVKAQHRSAFTLIELLVVIAIIAILAAILFPVFLSARESARVSRCVANFENIGRALGMYREDWDGRNCHIWQNAGKSPGGCDDQGSFFWVITRYVGQSMDWRTPAGNENKARNNVYKCPSAPWLKQQTQGQAQGYAIGIGSRLNVGFAYTLNETNWNHRKFAAGGPLRSYSSAREWAGSRTGLATPVALPSITTSSRAPLRAVTAGTA